MAAPSKMNNYSITVTSSDGLQPDHLVRFRTWFAQTTDSCLVVTERHASGKLHLHAGTRQRQKTPNEITRMLVRICESLNILVVKGITIKVKRTTNLIGWFHYLTKDLGDADPLLVQGWQLTWIQQQCRENMKKMPHKMIKGDDFTMNMVTAPNLVIQYAKRHGLAPPDTKDSFATVICLMAKDGYQIHSLKLRILYCEIAARFDSMAPLRSLIEHELEFC